MRQLQRAREPARHHVKDFFGRQISHDVVHDVHQMPLTLGLEPDTLQLALRFPEGGTQRFELLFRRSGRSRLGA